MIFHLALPSCPDSAVSNLKMELHNRSKHALILCFTTTPETFMESCKDEDETNDMVEKGCIV